MKLKLDETILRCRREKNLTQEELASALGVSPQSISNWEHGGYPDIELLPSIANYFGITVDELIGNDKISVEADIASFPQKYYAVNGEERLKLALTYYRKYPNNFTIMELLACVITYGGFSKSAVYRKLLCEVCERIIGECTDAMKRENAVFYMCRVAEGEEFERWCAMLPVSFGLTYYETKESHLWENGAVTEARRLYGRNNTALLLYFACRDYHADGDAKRAEVNSFFRMKLLACGKNGEVPDGFLGQYAFYRLCHASALFGCGRTEEGFAELTGAVDDYLRSYDLPDDVPLPLGPDELFGGIRCIRHRKKGMLDTFVYEDGTPADYPPGGSHHLDPNALYDMLTHGPFSSGWFDSWFDAVQEEERFAAQLERVKTYMENYRR